MNIPFRPILSAMTRHKAIVFLIAMQIALTLAIVANAIFVIDQRVKFILRPSGIDEPNIVIADNRWVDMLTLAQAQVKTAADLAMLRQLPGVLDAYADYSYPVAGPVAELWGVNITVDQLKPSSYAEPYFADDHTLATYGVRLNRGRNFTASELALDPQTSRAAAGPVLITEDLASKLFAAGSALGQVIFIGNVPKSIVGIISNMQVPAVGTRSFAYRSIFSPVRYADATGNQYVVHTRPGQALNVQKSLAAALFKVSNLRMIDDMVGVQTFHTLRNKAYSRDRGLVILLSTACIILLFATVGGIVGVTIFWVGERQREIGVRRALGATRLEISAHILTENFFIVSAGVAVGVFLAFLTNLGLMRYLEMSSLPALYVAVGSFLVLLVGQCSAITPARRAAQVSPMEATRLATAR